MTHPPEKIIKNELLSHKLIFISGKGGTGKSVTAVSLARLATDEGLKVLLVESSGVPRHPHLLGIPPYGHKETSAEKNLWGINLEPGECFREFVEEHLGLRQLYRRVFRHRIMQSFIEAIPGLNEIMILGRLHHACLRDRNHPGYYDLTIVDAPASGHFQGLITTPDAVISSGMMGPLIREIEKIRNYLADPEKTACLLVAQPEPLIMNETLEFIHKIQQKSPVKLAGVLLNRSFEGEEHYRESLSKDSGFGENSAVTTYLRNRFEQFICQKDLLLQEFSNLSLPPGFLCLPECGVISEPLDPGFSKLFWKGLCH